MSALLGAYTGITAAWMSGGMSAGEAGLYYGVVGALVGICCGIIGALSKRVT